LRSLIILFILIISKVSFASKEISHRKCLALPMSKHDKATQEFHNLISKYLQTTDWCVYSSTNGIVDILKKYDSSLSKFVEIHEFRLSVVKKSGANSLIFFRNEKRKSIEVWDINGLLFKKYFTDGFNSNEAIKFLQEYQKLIPYEASVTSIEPDSVLISGGTRFGFDPGDRAVFYKKINSVFHPRLKEFVNFSSVKKCIGEVLMSNYNSTYIKPSKNCERSIEVGDHVKLINLTNVNKTSINKEKRKFIDVNTGFGISYLNLNVGGGSLNKFSGPKFSFDLDFDLLLTRNIVTGIQVGGLYAIISGENSSTDLDLLNTFGSRWSGYVSYRYWLENFSKNSFIDFSLGYRSNFFGFNSSEEDFVSGQKYYGLLLQGNIALDVFGISFFSNLSFMPSANFYQEIEYINGINSVTGYEVSFGAYFNLFDINNLFSELKISKFKAASTSANLETSVQDVGIVFGYKFRL